MIVAFRSAKDAENATFAERKATIILQTLRLFHERPLALLPNSCESGYDAS